MLTRQAPGAVDMHRGSLGGLTMEEALLRIVAFGQATAKPAAVVLAIHPNLSTGRACVRGLDRGEGSSDGYRTPATRCGKP